MASGEPNYINRRTKGMDAFVVWECSMCGEQYEDESSAEDCCTPEGNPWQEYSRDDR